MKELRVRQPSTISPRISIRACSAGCSGRYYDRIFHNAGLDEKFRLQFGVRYPF
jgi:hypothetical protein